MLKAYIQLFKPRLASLVLFSALISYLMAVSCPNYHFDGAVFLLLTLGGFLVIGSANGFNQILEKETDALMDRTQDRPLPKGELSIQKALLFCTLSGLLGLYALYLIHYLPCLLGFLSWLSYVVVYTPLKRKSPVAVWVGAIPGALPYLIGWTAATSNISVFAWILFGIQFFWQFPHFWAIAWVLEEDYAKAGIRLLPSKKGKDQATTFQIITYSIFLVIISYAPYLLGYSNAFGIVLGVLTFLTGLYLLSKAFYLHRFPEQSNAKKLMLASLIYLPIVQLLLYLAIVFQAIQICDL